MSYMHGTGTSLLTTSGHLELVLLPQVTEVSKNEDEECCFLK